MTPQVRKTLALALSVGVLFSLAGSCLPNLVAVGASLAARAIHSAITSNSNSSQP